jgi:hypothetical protein
MFAAVAFAGDVKTDYDHHTDFSKFHTYSWKSVKTANQLYESRIKDAVGQQLQAKGWKEVPDGGDVVLTAVGAVNDRTEYQTFYDGMGGWRWGGFGNEETTPVNYEVGTLVVDMYTANDKHLIWRGTSSATLSSKPDKNTKKLDGDVKKMFKDFPPKEK